MLTDDQLQDFAPCQLHAWHIPFARAVEAEATAELRAENERLRGLLREARKAVESWTPDESNATHHELDELNRWYELRDHIDAALAAGTKEGE